MNILSIQEKAKILRALVEGCSIRSVERMTGHHRDTITRVMLEAGKHAKALMEDKMQNLLTYRIQVDEIWGYVKKKDKQINGKEGIDLSKIGSQYIFVAMDADTKIIPCFKVGKRTYGNAVALMKELKARTVGRLHLTTDSFTSYPTAIFHTFEMDVHYAQLVKVYGYNTNRKYKREGYSPVDFVLTKKKRIIGMPNLKKVSTSHVERQNLTMRMCLRRLTRLTNAFSKKLENLEAALWLHFAYYNFVRIHKSLRITPAMKAKITGSLWTLQDILMYERKGEEKSVNVA